MRTKLYFLRNKAKLTTRELADQLPANLISHSQITRIEKDKAKLTFDQIIELSNFFNVTTDYLLCQSNISFSKNPDLYQIDSSTDDKFTLKQILEKFSGQDIAINYSTDQIIITINPLDSFNRKQFIYKKC